MMYECIADECISLSYQSCTLKMSCEVSMVLLHTVSMCVARQCPKKFTAQTKVGALAIRGKALPLVENEWPVVAVSCRCSLYLALFRQRFMSPDKHVFKEDFFLFHRSGKG